MSKFVATPRQADAPAIVALPAGVAPTGSTAAGTALSIRPAAVTVAPADIAVVVSAMESSPALESCSTARPSLSAPLHAGEPGFVSELDRDGADCE